MVKKELKAKVTEETELQAMMEAAGLSSQWYVFEQLDEDGDGKITLEELKAALKPPPAEEAAAEEPPAEGA